GRTSARAGCPASSFAFGLQCQTRRPDTGPDCGQATRRSARPRQAASFQPQGCQNLISTFPRMETSCGIRFQAWLRPWLALFTLLPSVAAYGGGYVSEPTLDKGAPVALNVKCWLDSCPPTGLLPIRIEMTNRDKESHSYLLTTRSQDGVEGRFSMTIEGER